MKTAIIGLGNIGSRLAKNLTNGGESVIVADRTFAKAQALAGEIGSRATAVALEEAIRSADVVILALYFASIKELTETYRSSLAGKIVVDPSNPIGPDGNGGFKKIVPADQSSGQLIAAMLPVDAELVKAFGTLGAEVLSASANRSPEKAVLFYATDYPEAGRVVSKLITASGYEPVNAGGLDQSIRIEAFGALSGKVVSVTEAKALV